jgi:hypothetical protein
LHPETRAAADGFGCWASGASEGAFPMNLNPHTKQLTELSERTNRLAKELHQLGGVIAAYESNSKEQLWRELNREVESHNHILSQLEQACAEAENARKKLQRVQSAIGTLWNPLNWADDEQERLRISRDRLVSELRELENRKQGIDQQFREAQSRYKNAKEWYEWYIGFDIDTERNRHARLADQARTATIERDHLQLRQLAVEKALRPHLASIAEIERELEDLRARKSLAEGFQSRLDEAGSSYERKLIHDKCEQAFGHGNPRKVLNETRPLIERFERDLNKTVDRATQAARDAGLVIASIVIDGNNLCFTSGSRFVGIEVLQKVVSDLSSKYQMFVVFDASIRRRLGLNDKAIQGRLDQAAEVHIMPSKEKADETVLDLAGKLSDRFVLSNDRYAEFPEKPAVAEGRLLKHEIVDGRVFIRALKYETNWKL